MKSWDDYRLILALHRSETLRGTAKLLDVNHSTVSRRLTALEEQCGATVFERVVGGYQATHLGKQLIAAAEQVESIALTTHRYLRASGAEISGPVTLSIPEAFGQFLLLDELADFCKLYPAIKLMVHTSSQLVDLDRSEADIVIRGANNPPDHLVGRRIFPYALCFYCHKDYLANTPYEQLRWIAGVGNDAERSEWIAASPFPDVPIGPRFDDITMRHRAALAGHGMVTGTCFMGDPEAQLVRLPNTKAFFHRDIWVLTHPDLRHTPRITTLLRFIAASLEEKKALIKGQTP